MNTVKEARLQRGLSQRRLAERSGLSFRGIQLLEKSDHDPRLSSLSKVANALGLPSAGLISRLRNYFAEDPESFACASVHIVADGFDSWKLHLFDAVDALRRRRVVTLIETAPATDLEHRLKAMLASTVETLCDELELQIPSWCCSVAALEQPWFVAGVESLKASALVESPTRYRQRNVFVLGNFLERV